MWSAYVKPEIVEMFQEKYNCTVVVDTYDSNESMYTKLKLGGAGYDVIFPSNYFLDLLASQEMLYPVCEEMIPNLRHIDWKFLQKLGLSKNRWGVPFMVSFSGIAWRTDRLKTAPSSWNIFSNKELKGRMTMLNDLRETVGAGLLYLGYSANSRSQEEIFKARDMVLQWKKQLAKLESEQYKNGIASAEYLVVHGYSGDCLQVSQENNDISFIYPKEGSIAAVDYGAVMKDSHDPELAFQFLNFLHEPKIAAENMAFTFYRCVNVEAAQFLPEDLRSSPLLYPETQGDIKFECIFSVGDARPYYLQAWNSIKSS
jgi:spermidine/putrescine transport system substrate-binding protein